MITEKSNFILSPSLDLIINWIFQGYAVVHPEIFELKKNAANCWLGGQTELVVHLLGKWDKCCSSPCATTVG